MLLCMLPRADRDIDDICLYFVEQQAICAGQRFLDAVDRSIRLLAERPTLASAWDSTRSTSGRRSLLEREGLSEVCHLLSHSRAKGC